jgi:hypothetical protein
MAAARDVATANDPEQFQIVGITLSQIRIQID